MYTASHDFSGNALRRMIERAKTIPHFLAYRMEQFQQRESMSDETLAGLLQITIADLDFLRLCRTPKSLSEVEIVAARVGCDAKVLAEMLGVTE